MKAAKKVIPQTKTDHLKRAQEFQDRIDSQPFISTAERLTLERLRDQRLYVARQMKD